jgi:hypothetical protein
MLYLQAKTQSIGMHPNRGKFAAELTKRGRIAGDQGSLRTIGVWEFVGLTGEWSRVLTLYEFGDGWADVCEQVRQSMQAPAPELEAIYRVADTMRSGGVDDILEALPGTPTLAEIRAKPGHGPVLVSEEVTVPPGGENAYTAEFMRSFGPVAAHHGLRLIGVYRHALTDVRVVAHWSADLDGYRSLMASGELRRWHLDNRSLHAAWRQELWTAAADSPFAATL